ncbi:antitoxin PaaA2 family protein [Sphingobium sp. CR28]|uniref:antitoxin PaaA2 family protein n=1 Tax=Sphingobium sp. CR28 TaxID=3400272 RepID=UPI003FF0C1ED
MPANPAEPVAVTPGVLANPSQSLERQEGALEALLRRRVEAALADPAPTIPQEEVFAMLRARHASPKSGHRFDE